jgi:hypothetical protein
MIGVFVGFSRIFLLGILIFKGLVSLCDDLRPRCKGTTHLHLVVKLSKSEGINIFPLYDFMTLKGATLLFT